MECTFHVGDRVVRGPAVKGACPACSSTYTKIPDDVFTISKVWWYAGGNCRHGVLFSAGVAVTVAEIDNPQGFYAYLFRPVKPLSFWIGEKQHVEVPRAIALRRAEEARRG